MSDERISGGRFGPGNKAAAGRRRQRVMTTQRLMEIADRTLAQLNEPRTVEDFCGELVLKLIEAASGGDVRAATWLLDKFAPPDRAPRASLGRLPRPSESPLEFLDAVARAVTSGKLSVDEGAKLGRLVGPLVTDAELARLAAELEKLQERVNGRDRRGPGSGPQVVRLVM